MTEPQKGTPEDWAIIAGDLPTGSDPLPKVIDRYAALPTHTRLFLERLSDEDIVVIVAGLRTIRITRAVYRVLKRLALWAIGVFTFTVAFGKQVGEFWQNLGTWLHPR